jgi:hypothetical protein
VSDDLYTIRYEMGVLASSVNERLAELSTGG